MYYSFDTKSRRAANLFSFALMAAAILTAVALSSGLF